MITFERSFVPTFMHSLIFSHPLHVSMAMSFKFLKFSQNSQMATTPQQPFFFVLANGLLIHSYCNLSIMVTSPQQQQN